MKNRVIVLISVVLIAVCLVCNIGCGGNDNKVTINFDSNGGAEISAIQKAKGEEITLPQINKDNYEFVGWCMDNGDVVENKFVVPDSDITLKAKWRNVVTGTDGIIYKTNDPFKEDDGHIVTGYDGSEKTVVIPSLYKGFPVLEIGENSFSNNGKIKSVVMGKFINTINENAFQNCFSMENIVIGKGINHIKASAFTGCESLTTLFYEGSEADFNKITVDNDNDMLKGAEKYYYSENQKTTGNYWHYGDDGKTILVWQKA